MKLHALLLSAVVTSAGCANVGYGLSATQRGMAVIDVGVDRWLSEFQEAAQSVRLWCMAQPEPTQCELTWGVADGDIDAITQAARLMSSGYDDTAEGLAKMQAAWALLLPRLQRVIEASEHIHR